MASDLAELQPIQPPSKKNAFQFRSLKSVGRFDLCIQRQRPHRSTRLKLWRTVGQVCSHPKGADKSVIGTKHADGSFKSRDTAQYPTPLCDAFAKIVHHLFSKRSLDLTCAQFMPLLGRKTPHEPPFVRRWWWNPTSTKQEQSRKLSSRCFQRFAI